MVHIHPRKCPTRYIIYIIQILWLPLGNVGYIIQIRHLSAPKYLNHKVGVDDLSYV